MKKLGFINGVDNVNWPQQQQQQRLLHTILVTVKRLSTQIRVNRGRLCPNLARLIELGGAKIKYLKV